MAALQSHAELRLFRSPAEAIISDKAAQAFASSRAYALSRLRMTRSIARSTPFWTVTIMTLSPLECSKGYFFVLMTDNMLDPLKMAGGVPMTDSESLPIRLRLRLNALIRAHIRDETEVQGQSMTREEIIAEIRAINAVLEDLNDAESE